MASAVTSDLTEGGATKGIACIALVVACELAAAASNTNDVKPICAANNQFGWDLYGRLAGQPGNLFFSPHSISAGDDGTARSNLTLCFNAFRVAKPGATFT